ncbi:MAG: NAD(P)H-binding protein [Chlorobiaceae bacterium]|nr:NAD(P)H-binding protein [Chlorobiaceae bacterium]
MNYIVTGSLGHVGKPLASLLLDAGHSVTIVSNDPEKKAKIEAMGATPALGSVEDIAFLTKTFKGADGVFTLVPPNYTGGDWKGHIAQIGRNYADAVVASGVRHVVNLSSIGAHLHTGCGPVNGLHLVEFALNALDGVNVRHLRAAYFYTNFINSIPGIRQTDALSGNFGKKTKLALVHPLDIADEAARELQNPSFLGRGFRYIASDERTTDDIATILGKAISRPGLQWIDRTDEESCAEMLRLGLPDELAKNYTEMGSAIRSGEMMAHYFSHRPVLAGWRRLETFAPDFAAAWASS